MELESKLQTFAQRVLFGSTLEDKLAQPDLTALREELFAPLSLRQSSSIIPSVIPSALFNPPKYPGRPSALSLETQKKSQFPDLAKIHEAHVRGEILHFFANHELLALELMALLLLKFPEAPASFQLGIARTMSEEQGHLKLYLSRMKDLGVEFGDLPVNAYFWHVLSEMRSPLEFVTQMSLTFEQANLDFSLFYRDEIAKTGDELTTQVLDQVYREEIGHVKNGLEWFNRWRAEDPNAQPGETDWDAYRRLLPPPLTPRRAKGVIYDMSARRQAGFSELYVQELELFSGAKGRPPVLWFYNPFCDSEIARGKPGFSPKAAPERLAKDLEHFPMYLASSQDIVLVSKKPGLEWLSLAKNVGFEIPEWGEKDPSAIQEPKFGGFEPWGWSPESFERFKPVTKRLVHTSGGNASWCESLFKQNSFKETQIGELFSKAWSVEFLRRWLQTHPEHSQSFQCIETCGEVFTDWEKARERILQKLEKAERVVAKAPWSTSGNGVRRILSAAELSGPLGGWMENTIRSQGVIVIEPWLDKVHDLSIQLEIESDQIRILEARKFLTGKQFEYRGTFLGPLRDSFDSAALRLLQEALPSWKALARDLGQELRAKGYQGPVGIDAMIYQGLRLKPIVEINPRWTMGRVALSLEKHIQPGTPAFWGFLSCREIQKLGFSGPVDLVSSLSLRHPLRLAIPVANSSRSTRIASGVFPTQDPNQTDEVLTLLFVGAPAIQEAQKLMAFSASTEASQQSE
jgi:uncharacterized ferritin-like protein (DUF455 family)